MTTPLGGIFVAGLYLAFTVVLWVGLNPNIPRPSPSTAPNRQGNLAEAGPQAEPGSAEADEAEASLARLAPTMFLFWLAALAHAAFTVIDLSRAFPDASIAKALSLTTLLMIVSILVLCTRYRLHILLLLFAPLAAVAALIASVSSTSITPFSPTPLVFWHLTLALVGATLCLLTVPLAFIAQAVSRQLNSAMGNAWLERLPPLASIERLIINLAAVATALLLLATAAIVPEVDDILDQRLAHKIFFTVFALIALVALLGGRWIRGWRGKHLAWMVYAANICLVLAYFGTKAVLEIILGA